MASAPLPVPRSAHVPPRSSVRRDRACTIPARVERQQRRRARADTKSLGPRLLSQVDELLGLGPRNEDASAHGQRDVPPVRKVTKVLQRLPASKPSLGSAAGWCVSMKTSPAGHTSASSVGARAPSGPAAPGAEPLCRPRPPSSAARHAKPCTELRPPCMTPQRRPAASPALSAPAPDALCLTSALSLPGTSGSLRVREFAHTPRTVKSAAVGPPSFASVSPVASTLCAAQSRH